MERRNVYRRKTRFIHTDEGQREGGNRLIDRKRRVQKYGDDGGCTNAEEGGRSKMKAKALKECDNLLAKFTECARGRTFSVVWVCREQHREMNECLKHFTNDGVLEEYKRQYVLEQGDK